MKLDDKERVVLERREEFIKAHGLTVRVSSELELCHLEPGMTKLIIAANSFNNTDHLLSTSLASLNLQDNFLVPSFTAHSRRDENLPCITTDSSGLMDVSPSIVFSLCSCFALQVLVVENNSFHSCEQMILSDLPALVTLQIGIPGEESNCFVNASFVIRSWLMFAT